MRILHTATTSIMEITNASPFRDDTDLAELPLTEAITLGKSEVRNRLMNGQPLPTASLASRYAVFAYRYSSSAVSAAA